jgi:hypothetical protein
MSIVGTENAGTVWNEMPPTVRYEVFFRVPNGAWVAIPFPANGEFEQARMMPEYCLFPAVLATYLQGQQAHNGDWQLRAVDVTTGEIVAIATIQEGI